MDKPSKAGLLVSALLFAGWIGYLAYMVITDRQAVVLSRPQILVASAVVVAEVKESNGKADPQVKVLEVRRADRREDEWQKLVGEIITLRHASPDRTDWTLDQAHGWRGPGQYLIPLDGSPESRSFAVVDLTSRSPGYNMKSSQPFIYPNVEQASQQLERIPKVQLGREDE
jgi:hypothetical protein